MPDILHRISIDAPSKEVHDVIASTDGIARWWTGRPVPGQHAPGSSFSVYFGDADRPAAVMRVVTDHTVPGTATVPPGAHRSCRRRPDHRSRRRRSDRRAGGAPAGA